MHFARIKLTNIRSINEFEIKLDPSERAGWHVILGDNGAGKSSVIRSIALCSIGPTESQALRQDWSNWLQNGKDTAEIDFEYVPSSGDKWAGTGKTSNAPIKAQVKFQGGPATTVPSGPMNRRTVEPPKFTKGKPERTVWGSGNGWFAASFGPFRRFSGGDISYDRMFLSNPKAAAHLSAFGEEVALTEALRWLQLLRTQSLEKNSQSESILNAVVTFVNGSDLLPHNSKIESISSDSVVIKDGDGNSVNVNQMSDGYRSILSLTFELLRQMFNRYEPDYAISQINPTAGSVMLHGVVAIDEIDAHLHPAWQKSIGQWFVSRFPYIQFFVTTHSPIICQAAAKGSVWRLPTPGTQEVAGRIVGDDLNKLIYGSILDAFGTQFFGVGVTRSQASKEKLMELARLNRKSLTGPLPDSDKSRLQELRAALPSSAAKVADDA